MLLEVVKYVSSGFELGSEVKTVHLGTVEIVGDTAVVDTGDAGLRGYLEEMFRDGTTLMAPHGCRDVRMEPSDPHYAGMVSQLLPGDHRFREVKSP